LNMLLEHTGLTVEEIVAIWKREGNPELLLDSGDKIGNLERYLEIGIMDINHLGVISEQISIWQSRKVKM